MAIREIIKEGNECLRKKSRPADTFDARLAELLDDLRDTMKKADGAGLAAPQVGIMRRVAVADDGETLVELINPVITEKVGVQFVSEGCLSVDSSKNCKVKRPQSVTFTTLDRTGAEKTLTVTGLLARAVCHEIDHMDGILFIDKPQDERGPAKGNK